MRAKVYKIAEFSRLRLWNIFVSLPRKAPEEDKVIALFG